MSYNSAVEQELRRLTSQIVSQDSAIADLEQRVKALHCLERHLTDLSRVIITTQPLVLLELLLNHPDLYAFWVERQLAAKQAGEPYFEIELIQGNFVEKIESKSNERKKKTSVFSWLRR